MAWQEHISIEGDVLGGKPVVRGTRLSVDFILELLALGWSEPDIVRNYPGISNENIRACFAFASAHLRDERVYPLKA